MIWPAQTQREDGHDVGHKKTPIKEQPNKTTKDTLALSGKLATRRMDHNERNGDREEMRAQRVEHRREDPGLAGPSSRIAATSVKQSVASTSSGKPVSQRRETTMSGWVMVNVETSTPTSERTGTPQSGHPHPKSSSHTPPPTRPTRIQHQRSVSDSRILTTRGGPSPVGPAPNTNTMSAAAKTIAMIDATEASQEKSSSAFKRIFGRAKHTPEPQESRGGSRTPPGTWVRKSPDQQDSRERVAELKGRVTNLEHRMRAKDRGRTTARGGTCRHDEEHADRLGLRYL